MTDGSRTAEPPFIQGVRGPWNATFRDDPTSASLLFSACGPWEVVFKEDPAKTPTPPDQSPADSAPDAGIS